MRRELWEAPIYSHLKWGGSLEGLSPFPVGSLLSPGSWWQNCLTHTFGFRNVVSGMLVLVVTLKKTKQNRSFSPFYQPSMECPFHPALREKMREPEDSASVSSPGTRQGTPNKVSHSRTDWGSRGQAVNPALVQSASFIVFPGTQWPCDTFYRIREPTFRKKLFTGWII